VKFREVHMLWNHYPASASDLPQGEAVVCIPDLDHDPDEDSIQPPERPYKTSQANTIL